MSLILHLSDLHLGETNKSDYAGDYKSDILQPHELTTRYSLLSNTFRELRSYLSRESKHLDVVIISGDITVANDEAGFQKLEEVLSGLEAARPPAAQVLIVPGNHDVKWETEHGSPERYQLFLQYVRNAGYITPYLEGLDLNNHGVFTDPIEKHSIISTDFKWAIVPINSSDFCGSIQRLNSVDEATWNSLPDYLSTATKKDKLEIAKEFRKLRVKDVARVSTAQLLGLKSLVEQIVQKCSSGGVPNPMLIGVLHHHLLPVSPFEEFKEFESLTNLGHVRCALRDIGFAVVLHGHKHVDFSYVDEIPPMLTSQGAGNHSITVMSAQAPTFTGFNQGSLGRLIETIGHSLVTSLSVTAIPWTPAGTAFHPSEPTLIPLPGSKRDLHFSSNTTLIEGNSVDEVYERALSKLTPDNGLSNFICRVTSITSTVRLPVAYPELREPDQSDRESWFASLVDWWQKNDFQRLSPGTTFNHGHRIFSYSGATPYKSIDQVQTAIDALRNSPLTSRAVVTLLKPHVDGIASNTQFPSFCLLQFVVRQDAAANYLEAIGFFRKQEIKYWWPVNVAEIARLQKRVFDDIKTSVEGSQRRELRLGAITTIAAIAEIGMKQPAILVPAVDFQLEVKPQELWDMTYAACWRGMENRNNHVTVWDSVLNSLEPAERRDPSGVLVPVSGIRYLAEITQHFAAHHPGDPTQLAAAWKRLAEINFQHSVAMTNNNLSDADHTSWRNNVLHELATISSIVQRCFAP